MKLAVALIATLAVSLGSATTRAAEHLVIIAPKSLHAAVVDFAAAKQQWMAVDTVVLEDVLASAEGADAPEKIKRHLWQLWRDKRATAALLVGDCDVFPVRYMVLDRRAAPAFDHAFYPSDLYYADLARADGTFDDWNARRDGVHASYFGEVRGEANKEDPINFDGVDYLPDIAVGRWPVSTPEAVRRIAIKSLGYDRAARENASPALRRAAFVSVDGWVDSRPVLGRFAEALGASWTATRHFYGSDTPPTREALHGIFASGAGLVVHAGHGQPHEWEQCFSVHDLDALAAAPAAPVVLSAGCSTAHFAPLPPYEPFLDSAGNSHRGTDRGEVFTAPPPPPAPLQTGSVNPTCLGEQVLLKEGNGAVAYIGCNTGSQPCGLTLVDGFGRALASQPEPTLGSCWTAAIRHYHQRERLAALTPTADWYPPSIFFQGMKFMVFGDPTLRLPGNTPPPAPPLDPAPAGGSPAGS